MNMKDRHSMIQAMAKEKKSTCIVNSLQEGNKIIQGQELQKLLFQQVKRKFNPDNLTDKII